MIPEAEKQHQRFKVTVRFFLQEIQQSLYFFAVSRLEFAVCGDEHHFPFKNPAMTVFLLCWYSVLSCFFPPSHQKKDRAALW